MQTRILSALPAVPAQPRELYKRLKEKLQGAVMAGALDTSAYEVSGLVRLKESGDAAHITGGNESGFDCVAAPGGHFRRADGAWFAFRFTLTAGDLDSYRCQICFPGSVSPTFLRFDLDRPGKTHEADGLRSHLHPGANGLHVPAPVLGPLELVDLFLYGLQRGETPTAG